jgi:hypothetical protein
MISQRGIHGQAFEYGDKRLCLHPKEEIVPKSTSLVIRDIKREYPRIAIQLVLQEMSCSLSNFYTRILKRTLMSFLGKYAPLEGLCSGIVKSFPLAGSMSHVEMIAAENSRIVLSARARPLQPETPPPNG